MAYKFQLGAYTASGSLTQEGAVEVDALTADSANLQSGGITNAGSIAGATSIDGSGDLTMGTITMTGFTVDADGDTALKSLLVDDDSTIGCDSDADLLTLGDGVLTVAGEVSMTTLDIGGTNVTATAAEINLIDGGTARGTTALASGDGFLHNDAGTMRMTSIDKLADFFAGDGLGASSGVMEVQVSGAVAVKSDKIALSSSIAGSGLTLGPGEANSGVVTTLEVDIPGLTDFGAANLHQTQDNFMVSDNGQLKKISFSKLEDEIFANVSGEATIAAGGALTIANNAIVQSKLADDAVGADELAANAVVDASVASDAAISFAKINTNVDMGGNFSIGNQANDTATFAGHLTVGGNLTVQGSTTSVDSTTINISSSFTFEGPADAHETTLHCGGDGTGDAPQADSTIYLPALSAGNYYLPVMADKATAASAAVTAAEFALLDGGSTVGTTALASGDGFLHNDAGTMKQTSIDKIADLFAGNGITATSAVLAVDINGVSNTLTAIDQADLFALADADDSNEVKKITFSNLEDQIFSNVSGDIAIAAGGAATIQANAVEGSMLNNNIVSGLDDISADIVNTDEMIISDGGTIKRTDMSRLKTFIGNGTAAVANKDDGDTLAVGVNYFSNHGGAESVTLPASSDMSVGESVKIKAGSDCSTTNTLTVNKAGSQTIDGATAIVLESPFAAVELVYVAADLWRVF